MNKNTVQQNALIGEAALYTEIPLWSKLALGIHTTGTMQRKSCTSWSWPRVCCAEDDWLSFRWTYQAYSQLGSAVFQIRRDLIEKRLKFIYLTLKMTVRIRVSSMDVLYRPGYKITKGRLCSSVVARLAHMAKRFLSCWVYFHDVREFPLGPKTSCLSRPGESFLNIKKSVD